MAKITGPTNKSLNELITELRKSSNSHNSNLWKRIADELSRPTRQRRVVNLSSINRNTKENENIIVPGKVLATGELDHKVTIAAWQFSGQALDKIKKSNSKAILIKELIKEKPDGKGIRIIG
ncbi:MAG: 50S ribosomal protein L18e [Candidatus Nanoarchaeia archaeon]|nr:50S ribosomal protein L18e [Candidatus Nanoarchaeia archaeon]